MRYISTRGEAPALSFEDVVFAGLAIDGGLYLPERWPQLEPAQLRQFAGQSWTEVAVAVMAPFVEPCISRADLQGLVEDAAATFSHPAITPLVPLGPNTQLLELFHGPTLAFKDVALQLLGRIFDHLLARRSGRVTIIGATSGDTGSAAIEGCRGRDALDIFILHPHQRTSEVQRRQMSTVLDANVYNIALQGSFDDCQNLVKAMFRDPRCRQELRLTAVNSINWARVMAQIVYYVTAAVACGAPDVPVSFTVPTGNFGDVFAGWCARRMGLPIAQLVVATNENDILARFFATGEYRMAEVRPTWSPSMDIQISSNFERLLFEIYDRDPVRVRAHMADLQQARCFRVTPTWLERGQEVFSAQRVDDVQTLETIRRVHADTGRLIDPHTAVAVAAAQATPAPTAGPMVVLSTAHAAKFPAAVEAAIGEAAPLPPHLADIFDRPERLEVLPNDRATVERFVRRHARVLQPSGDRS